jgi:hypothetical protein
MEYELFPLHHKGMPRVIAPLKPDDQVRLGSQEINDFPLAFVSPLGANHHCI